MASQKICSIPGCGKKHKAKDLCVSHYQRYRSTGSPYPSPKPRTDFKCDEIIDKKENVCGLDGCERKIHCRKLCHTHYQRLRMKGDVFAKVPILVRYNGTICSAKGCPNLAIARGFCDAHYSRFKIHGNPLEDTPLATARGAAIGWLLDHAGHDSDECLQWPFGRGEDGYGLVRYNGKIYRPSRAMCELVNGPPPAPNLDAAHSCGKGHDGCVNPKHLRWATRKENIRDKFLHGNGNCGENSNASKLKDADVIAIREMISEGAPHKEIARQFNVSQPAISAIRNRKTWKHLP